MTTKICKIYWIIASIIKREIKVFIFQANDSGATFFNFAALLLVGTYGYNGAPEQLDCHQRRALKMPSNLNPTKLFCHLCIGSILAGSPLVICYTKLHYWWSNRNIICAPYIHNQVSKILYTSIKKNLLKSLAISLSVYIRQ